MKSEHMKRRGRLTIAHKHAPATRSRARGKYSHRRKVEMARLRLGRRKVESQ